MRHDKYRVCFFTGHLNRRIAEKVSAGPKDRIHWTSRQILRCSSHSLVVPGHGSMPPDLPFYPFFYHREAETRMTDTKVVHAVLTPMLMVIVMITGDFLAISLATDRVRPSPIRNSWQIGKTTSAGVIWELVSWHSPRPSWWSADSNCISASRHSKSSLWSASCLAARPQRTLFAVVNTCEVCAPVFGSCSLRSPTY